MQGQSSAKFHPTADDATIQALADAGKSTREVAAIVGNIAHQTIARRLKHLTPRQTTEIFKTHRADIFAELQRKILLTCDKQAIKEMHPRDRFLATGLLYDKEQIERGHGADARPLVMIQINTGKPEPVDKTVDNLIPNHINTIEVR